MAETGATAFAAAPTEAAEPGAGGDELEVSARLLDDGALVRWRGAGAGERCVLRWYSGPSPGDRLLATAHTHHDYMLSTYTRVVNYTLKSFSSLDRLLSEPSVDRGGK